SELGLGSCFEFSIPVVVKSRSTYTERQNVFTFPKVEDNETSLQHDNQPWLLIVEDTIVNQKVVRIMLEKLGVRVSVAN
ncbi:hypothetical protein, partial [Salmonella sp. ZJJH19_0069]|uniref:hypothetical protein n=1 Tax=Salmonella sp. ZJJH19_0069 TaxID=3159617 RepID=UPI00397F1FBB